MQTLHTFFYSFHSLCILVHSCQSLQRTFFTEVFGLQKGRKQTLDCPNQIKIKTNKNINKKNLFILGFIYLFQVEYLRPRISISCSFRGEGQPFFLLLCFVFAFCIPWRLLSFMIVLFAILCCCFEESSNHLHVTGRVR